jgi:guanylate kinase
VDKLSVTQEEMDRADARGEFLVINEFYGTRYATPLAPITNSLAAGGFPLIDWPVARLAAMEARFSGQLFRCYLRPPTLAVLEARLRLRDGSNERLAEAELEWTKMASGEFDHCVDLMATADDGAAAAVARRIHSAFLSMNGEVVNKHEQ